MAAFVWDGDIFTRIVSACWICALPRRTPKPTHSMVTLRAMNRKSRTKKRWHWSPGDHPACGSRSPEHRAHDCGQCRSEYNRRRRAPFGQKKRHGGAPPCGSRDPAHRRRECSACKRHYDRLTWSKRANRVRNALKDAPEEVRAPIVERTRLRARAWALVRRRDIPQRCIEESCGSTNLKLRYVDTDDGVLVRFACQLHRNLAVKSLADLQAEEVLSRATRIEAHMHNGALTYEDALRIARGEFGAEVHNLQRLAQHVSGLPIPVPMGSPLFRRQFVRVVEERLRRKSDR